MKLHLTIPSVLLGLSIGFGIRYWLLRKNEPALNADVPAMPGKSPLPTTDAWKAMLEQRSPMPTPPDRSKWGDGHMTSALSGISKTHAQSPLRGELATELFRHSLPLEALSYEALTGLGDSGVTKPPAFPDGLREALERIAKSDPREAMKHLASQPPADVTSHREAILSQWVKTTPNDALAYVMEQQSDMQRGDLLTSLLDQWSRLDPSAAAQAFSDLPKEHETASYLPKLWAEAIFQNWLGKDASGAKQWINAMKDEDIKTRLQAVLAAAEANTPAAKVEVLLAQSKSDPEGGNSHELTMAMSDWLAEDPTAAMARLKTIPAKEPFWQRDAESIANRWAMMQNLTLGEKKDTEGILKPFLELPPGPPRDAMLAGLVNYGASNDIPFATKILPQMTEGRAKQQAVSGLAELWMREDPMAVSQWLKDLPESESRQAGVERMAMLLVKSDPEAAKQWAETLPEGSAQRKEVLERVQGR